MMLTKKSAKSSTISVRVPASIKSKLDDLKDRADKQGLTIPINDELIKSLQKVLQVAEKELDDIENNND